MFRDRWNEVSHIHLDFGWVSQVLLMYPSPVFFPPNPRMHLPESFSAATPQVWNPVKANSRLDGQINAPTDFRRVKQFDSALEFSFLPCQIVDIHQTAPTMLKITQFQSSGGASYGNSGKISDLLTIHYIDPPNDQSSVTRQILRSGAF